jgi:hypothetical protein
MTGIRQRGQTGAIEPPATDVVRIRIMHLEYGFNRAQRCRTCVMFVRHSRRYSKCRCMLVCDPTEWVWSPQWIACGLWISGVQKVCAQTLVELFKLLKGMEK